MVPAPGEADLSLPEPVRCSVPSGLPVRRPYGSAHSGLEVNLFAHFQKLSGDETFVGRMGCMERRVWWEWGAMCG